jgi:hypothetical protein
MKNNYEWQGKPCDVLFGYVLQEENTEKPLYWYNFECHTKEKPDGSFKPERMCCANGKHFAVIPAVQVTQDGYSFLLANHYGIGVHKLKNGGWPNYAHFSLNGKFEESSAPYFAFKKFDLEEYERHESERRKWQKKEYPVNFEKLELLRQAGKSLYKGITK